VTFLAPVFKLTLKGQRLTGVIEIKENHEFKTTGLP
jgi:hypothetical protein